MKGIIRKYSPITIVWLGISVSYLFAQNKTVSISFTENKSIQLVGFTLSSDKKVKIEAVGAGGNKEIHRIHNFQEDPQNLFVYAWILDARSRALKWRMTISNTESDWWDKYNRVFKGDVELKKGEYELYFAAIEPNYFSFEEGFMSFGKIMDKVFGKESWWKDHAQKWNVKVSGVDETFETAAVFKYQKAVKNQSVINLTEIGDSEIRSAGFSLKKNCRLKIYAIGEGYEGIMYDYPWIIEAKSRQKVWEMTERESEKAGGAIKNRVAEHEQSFDPGDYIIYYKSDDTHSANKWNANPPYDPYFWGVTIMGADENFDRSAVSEFKEDTGQLIAALDRMGDDEDAIEYFKLLKPAKVRIFAIGEGRDGEMFDYGWIEEERSGEKIWQMHFNETRDAGGSSKNRMYDGVLSIEPGNYSIHFVTDDSHSYMNWNTSQPYDPEAWGIRLFLIESSDEGKVFEKYQPEQDKNIIVELIRVGNEEHVRKQFEMKQSGIVRVYAIGEGDWDEMYDYAWIEDFNTGRTVWKMQYRDTRRAGGDSKNRLFDGQVHLRQGIYMVHYQTDDSHAFGDWNATPPGDKSHWGVTIFNLKE